MKTIITSDSTCDLSPELLEQFQIRTLPLHVVRPNGEEYFDGVNIKPADIFRYADEDGKLCSTACISVGEYEGVFRAARERGDAVIHLNIGSGFSACHQNARIAAEGMDNVFVVDSQNLSTGQGNLVLDAAELALAGERPEQIVKELELRASKLETSFVINTLRYLHMGGRCSAVAALGANLLKLLPCIELRGGAMGVGKKYRGSFEKAILQYVRDRLTERKDIDYRRIILTDCMVPEEIRQQVRELVAQLADFDVTYTTEAGCAVSTHCGPCCLGILFFRK